MDLKIYKRYPHFIIVGFIGLALNYTLTFIFTEVFLLWYLFSFILATLITWTFNFYFNSRYTFKGHARPDLFKSYINYLQVYSLLGLVAFGLAYVLTSIIGLYYLLSIFIVTLVMSLITFMFNKKIVFKYRD